jgi:hypothetical protein
MRIAATASRCAASNPLVNMSQLGQTLHIHDICAMSACAPTPDISLRRDEPSRGVRRLLFEERAPAPKLQQVRHVLP